MTLGETIAKKLQNPIFRDIAKSEFLLLRAIAEHGPLPEGNICERLNQQREKDFIFMFGVHKPHTLHDELIRYLELGLIDINGLEKARLCYVLTESGRKVLDQYQSRKW